MQITNGSVSRTYKPADYEARTVSFSFTLEPHDDEDAATARVAFLAEKHARHMPSRDEAPAEPVKRTRRAAAPAEQPTSTEEQPADPFAAGTEAVSSAPASVPVSDIVSQKAPPTPAVEITDATLQDAIKAKVAADAKHTPGVMALIQTFTGEPTAKIYTVADQGKRAEFLAALAAL